MAVLKRTQMYLPEDILADLKKRAKSEGVTTASIVRDAVAEFLKKNRRADWSDDPLWKMVGAGASRDGDLSVQHDKYLYGKKG